MARLKTQIIDEESSDSEFEDAQTKPSKRQRLSRLGDALLEGPKRFLTRHDFLDETTPQVDDESEAIPGITDDPSFNVGMIMKQDSERPSTKVGKTLSAVAQSIVHPRKTAQRKAESRMTPPSQHPYLTDEADQMLLDANAELHNVESRAESADPAQHMAEQVETVKQIERHRSSMKNAWVTSRHVKRVRAVRLGELEKPRYQDYRVVDSDGTYERVEWGRYLGHLLLWMSDDFGPGYVDDTHEIAFKRGTLIHNCERVLMATTPWQKYLLHVRKVYLWEDWRLSSRWLLTYLFLMKTGLHMTFFYLFIVFTVVKNRYLPTSASELRISHERALDKSVRVRNFSELIQRHGREDWLDPLLDEIGPLIQQQLGDLADFLEIMQNFYEWRSARATLMTVFFWLCCAATAGLSSAAFGNKVFWWVCGLYFFASRPIASRYPKYRHLVSIFRWIFWDVPTDAEVAITHLQQRAAEHRIVKDADFEAEGTTASRDDPKIQSIPAIQLENLQDDSDPESSGGDSEASDTSVLLSEKTILTFRGRLESRAGRLVVTDQGIRFEVTSSRGSNVSVRQDMSNENVLFSYSYSSLREMRKTRVVQDQMTKRILSKVRPMPEDGIFLAWNDGTECKIGGMRKRDEAFNALIGFSGLRWQVLSPILEAGEGAEDGKKGFFGQESALAQLRKV